MTGLHKLWCVAIASAALFACSNELKGDLKVDGDNFALDSCRSGQVYGFVGVEVVSKEGAKIKIMQTPTGEAVAYYQPSGSATGVELGKCGTFQVSTQSSTINDVKNVEGQALMDCEAAGHTVKGNFTFSNCH
jgi:hypothetical protein